MNNVKPRLLLLLSLLIYPKMALAHGLSSGMFAVIATILLLPWVVLIVFLSVGIYYLNLNKVGNRSYLKRAGVYIPIFAILALSTAVLTYDSFSGIEKLYVWLPFVLLVSANIAVMRYHRKRLSKKQEQLDSSESK